MLNSVKCGTVLISSENSRDFSHSRSWKGDSGSVSSVTESTDEETQTRKWNDILKATARGGGRGLKLSLPDAQPLGFLQWNSCRNELKQHLKVERNENTEARGRSGRGWVGHEASSSRGGLGSHGRRLLLPCHWPWYSPGHRGGRTRRPEGFQQTSTGQRCFIWLISLALNLGSVFEHCLDYFY